MLSGQNIIKHNLKVILNKHESSSFTSKLHPLVPIFTSTRDFSSTKKPLIAAKSTQIYAETSSKNNQQLLH